MPIFLSPRTVLYFLRFKSCVCVCVCHLAQTDFLPIMKPIIIAVERRASHVIRLVQYAPQIIAACCVAQARYLSRHWERLFVCVCALLSLCPISLQTIGPSAVVRPPSSFRSWHYKVHNGILHMTVYVLCVRLCLCVRVRATYQHKMETRRLRTVWRMGTNQSVGVWRLRRCTGSGQQSTTTTTTESTPAMAQKAATICFYINICCSI